VVNLLKWLISTAGIVVAKSGSLLVFLVAMLLLSLVVLAGVRMTIVQDISQPKVTD
jgi:hypothetical protein